MKIMTLRDLVRATLCMVVITIGVAAQGIPDAQIVTLLGSNSQPSREEAIRIAQSIPFDKRSDVLWMALVGELHRLNDDLDERRRVRGNDKASISAPGLGEYYGEVLELVSKWKDERAIGALVRSLGTGNMVINALASFPQGVVEPVSALVLSASTPTENINGGLRTLRRIAERQQDTLPSKERAELLRVARERLRGHQHVTTLAAAIELAAASGDEELFALAERFAEQPGEIAAHGIHEPGLIAMVQRRAREALATAKRPVPRH